MRPINRRCGGRNIFITRYASVWSLIGYFYNLSSIDRLDNKHMELWLCNMLHVLWRMHSLLLTLTVVQRGLIFTIDWFILFLKYYI